LTAEQVQASERPQVIYLDPEGRGHMTPQAPVVITGRRTVEAATEVAQTDAMGNITGYATNEPKGELMPYIEQMTRLADALYVPEGIMRKGYDGAINGLNNSNASWGKRTVDGLRATALLLPAAVEELGRGLLNIPHAAVNAIPQASQAGTNIGIVADVSQATEARVIAGLAATTQLAEAFTELAGPAEALRPALTSRRPSGVSPIGNVGGSASTRPIFPGDPDFVGPLWPNPAHNAAAFERYQNLLTTTEAANPLVDSLNSTRSLPANYVTGAEARLAGWKPGKALNNSVPGGQMGGDVFNNTTGVLPSAPGRTWYEADVGLNSSMSRANQPGTRLLYSDDGFLYVTFDHYDTVHPIGTWNSGKP
jgi:hypothetical protein